MKLSHTLLHLANKVTDLKVSRLTDQVLVSILVVCSSAHEVVMQWYKCGDKKYECCRG